jgi:hypothetical protein
VVRAADDAAAEEEAFDVVALVEIERDLRTTSSGVKGARTLLERRLMQ